jgi:hypothetical protein
MSGMITTLLMVGLLVGGAYVLISSERRCEFLGLCGQDTTTETTGGGEEAAATAPAPVPVTLPPPTLTGASKGCCKCEMQGSSVKCIKNNTGAWFNPPPGTGGSNDQDVQLSLDECNKGCGSSSSSSSSSKNDPDPKGTGLADQSKPATKQKKVATGSAGNPGSTTKGVQNKNSSVVGSGQKISDANIKKAWAGAAFLTNDDRYTYYPNDVQSYYAAPAEYLEYKIVRPIRTKKRPLHYVRGNILYTYVVM